MRRRHHHRHHFRTKVSSATLGRAGDAGLGSRQVGFSWAAGHAGAGASVHSRFGLKSHTLLEAGGRRARFNDGQKWLAGVDL